MHVYVKGVVLFAISDHRARKLPFKFGALVGNNSQADTIVTGAIDIKTDAAGVVDFDYLHKRLSLLLAVSSNAKLVGLYCTEDADFDALLNQFANHQDKVPGICVTLGGEPNLLKCIDSVSKDPLPVTILPGESEEIATSTVHNHANYSTENPDIFQNTEETLMLSLEQLEQLMRKILATPSQGSNYDRTLVYLANLVAGYKQEKGTNYELYTSQLSLITNELLMINGLESQLMRRLFSQQAEPFYGK